MYYKNFILVFTFNLNLFDFIYQNVLTDTVYYVLNQLSWYILIQHLKIIKVLSKETNFNKIKQQTRKQEIGAVLFVVLFSIVWLGVITARNYFIIIYDDIDGSFINIGYYTFLTWILMMMVINEIFLYKLLNRLMKISLNFYYKTKMKTLRMLSITNTIFYFSYGFFNLFLAIFDPDIDEIVGLVPTESHSNFLVRLLYLLWLIICYNYLYRIYYM